MEKGNQADSAQTTPETGSGAAPAAGGEGTSAGPGTGTGTQGTPAPQPSGGGGSQADQSGPDDRPGRTYDTDGGTPPVGGPEPFSDIPPDPNLPEWKSWRDMPAQDVDLGEGRSLSLDGQGHLEYQEGGRTFRHEGSSWVDSQTGEPAPKSVAGRASGAQSQLESGLIPGTQR
jgi:hypothetical protein